MTGFVFVGLITYIEIRERVLCYRLSFGLIGVWAVSIVVYLVTKFLVFSLKSKGCSE